MGPPPAPSALRDRPRPRRDGPRRRRLAAAAAVVVALLVGTTYALGSGDGDEGREVGLGPARVRIQPNPAGAVWWARGTLHLEQAAVRLPSVVDLVVVDGGAVVTDDQQRVVHVREDGERTVLGRQQPGTGLVSSRTTGWVAWVQAGGEVVVHDVVGGREVDRHDLEIFDVATGRVVAIDRDTVHLTSAFGDVAWPPGGAPHVVQPPGLLDVSDGVRVTQQEAERIGIEQPYFSVAFSRRGRGGRLAPDGTSVLTTVPDDRSAYGTVRLYDARSGAILATGLGPGDVALASEHGEPGTVVHLVARLQDLPRTDDFVRSSFSGRLELRTCRLDDGRCTVDATIPAGEPLPVLATP